MKVFFLRLLDLASLTPARDVEQTRSGSRFAILSIVLAINQLVFSQEFGSAAEIRERVERIRTFREDVEDVAGEAPSPVVPTDFLRLVVDAIDAHASQLNDPAHELDAEAGQALAELSASVREEAGRARARLAASDEGRVSAILAVLDVDDALHLEQVRRVLAEHGSRLPARSKRTLEGLIELFEVFSVARTRFRTNYTQRVLARLSRLLLFVGVPAILGRSVSACCVWPRSARPRAW